MKKSGTTRFEQVVYVVSSGWTVPGENHYTRFRRA